MPDKFLTDGGKHALTDAVRALEARSSAELVFAVRPSSGRYLHVDFAVATVAAFLTLAFLLFSPWEFGLVSILLEPWLVGLLFGFVASRFPAIRPFLTRRKTLDEHVDQAAKATFFERRISQTTGRTGILIYVSLLERRAVTVVDVGVEVAVPEDTWPRLTAAIDDAVRRGGDATALAQAVLGLGDILEQTLERAPDDVNELPDEVHHP